jgi:hypothetical protein
MSVGARHDWPWTTQRKIFFKKFHRRGKTIDRSRKKIIFNACRSKPRPETPDVIQTRKEFA